MDLDQFPELPYRGRRVYVCGLDPLSAEVLRERGYEPVEVNTLPRTDDGETADYLNAKLQGIEEGSIAADDETRKLLELQMRALGLLDKRSVSMRLSVRAEASTIEDLFGWRQSRHTLSENSTVVSAQKLKRKN